MCACRNSYACMCLCECLPAPGERGDGRRRRPFTAERRRRRMCSTSPAKPSVMKRPEKFIVRWIRSTCPACATERAARAGRRASQPRTRNVRRSVDGRRLSVWLQLAKCSAATRSQAAVSQPHHRRAAHTPHSFIVRYTSLLLYARFALLRARRCVSCKSV